MHSVGVPTREHIATDKVVENAAHEAANEAAHRQPTVILHQAAARRARPTRSTRKAPLPAVGSSTGDRAPRAARARPPLLGARHPRDEAAPDRAAASRPRDPSPACMRATPTSRSCETAAVPSARARRPRRPHPLRGGKRTPPAGERPRPAAHPPRAPRSRSPRRRQASSSRAGDARAAGGADRWAARTDPSSSRRTSPRAARANSSSPARARSAGRRRRPSGRARARRPHVGAGADYGTRRRA